MRNKVVLFLLEIVKLSTYLISLSLVFFVSVFNILTQLFPDLPFIGNVVNVLPDLKTTVLIVLFFGGVGWFTSLKMKEVEIISLFKLPRNERVFYAIISVFLGYFFSSTVQLLSQYLIISFIMISIVFVFYLPQLGAFYLSSNFPYYLKIATLKNIPHNQIRRTLSILILTYFIFILIFSAVIYQLNQDIKFRGSLYIKDMHPKQAIYASLLEIRGYNFGWNPSNDRRYKLNSSYGEIFTNDWTNESIEFTVPLHLKEGQVTVWLERPDDKQNKILLSNRVSFLLLDRREFYPLKGRDSTIIERGIKKIKRFLFLQVGFPYPLTLPTIEQFN